VDDEIDPLGLIGPWPDTEFSKKKKEVEELSTLTSHLRIKISDTFLPNSLYNML
jgi:hypothetical protein